MDELSIRRGATLPLTLTTDEAGADTATITVSQDGSSVISKTVSFDDLTADLTLSNTDTDIAVGSYEYMITIVNDDGSVEKYPDMDGCTDCELPSLEICAANDIEVS